MGSRTIPFGGGMTDRPHFTYIYDGKAVGGDGIAINNCRG
jgi:hypothetical protein